MSSKKTHTTRLIIDGAAALDEILTAIQEAKWTIRIRAFMWRDDAIGKRILTALEKRITENPSLSIEIFKDAFGTRVYNTQKLISLGRIGGDIFSTSYGKKFIAHKNVTFSLVGSGSLFLFKYLKENDHSKVWLFDDHTPESKAIIGGMNIAIEYLTDQNHEDPDAGGWHDYMVIFYGLLADTVGLRPEYREPVPWIAKKVREGVEVLWSIKNRHLIRREILSELSRAKKSVMIEHGYITDGAIIRRLRQISQRGVRVYVIVSDRSDGVWHANMQSMHKLLKPNLLIKKENKNLSVFLYPGRIHAKAIVIDHKVAILGSANLTYGSFDLLSETNAIFRQTDGVVRDLLDQIEKDLSYCTRLTLDTIPPYKKWLAWMQKIFI